MARRVLTWLVVTHPPPAPMVAIALACCLGLGLAPALAVPPWAAASSGFALLLLSCLRARVSRPAMLAGWCLLGLARGGAPDEAPPLDGDGLWAVELLQDGRDPAGRALGGRLLAGWEPVDTGHRRLLWRGDLQVGLWLPSWPGGEPGRRGETWLVRGRLRPGRQGPTLSAGRSARLARVGLSPSHAARMRWPLDDVIAMLRRGARRSIDRGAPPRLRALFLALALGDRRQLDPAMRARLSRTGTAHLVALSGLHVGTALLVSAGAARWLLRRVVLRLGPGVAWTGIADVAALWVGLGVAVGYVLVAGAPTSARRALWMAAAAVLAFSLGRVPSGWNALAVAALGVAWLDPGAIASLGLQLSLASVGGLLAAAGLASGGGALAWRWLRSSAVSTSAATIATAPLLGLAFGQVPLASFWANPVAIPLLGVMTVPPLLLGAVLGSVDPALGALFVRLAGLPAGLGLDFLSWIGAPERAPMLAWRPDGAVVLALYASAGAALAGMRRRG